MSNPSDLATVTARIVTRAQRAKARDDADLATLGPALAAYYRGSVSYESNAKTAAGKVRPVIAK